MPDLYEKVVLLVFLCHLVQKLLKLLIFAIRIWRNPRWPPNEPHGTLVYPVNIDICSLDMLRSLKNVALIRLSRGYTWGPVTPSHTIRVWLPGVVPVYQGVKTGHTFTHPDAPCKNDFINSAVTYARCSLGGDTVCFPGEMGHAVSLQGHWGITTVDTRFTQVRQGVTRECGGDVKKVARRSRAHQDIEEHFLKIL